MFTSFLYKQDTNIITKFHCEITKSPFDYREDTTFSCHNKKDFQERYEEVIETIERAKKSHRMIEPDVKINLSGKLRGVNIEKEFNDLDSYQQFLINNELINTANLNFVNEHKKQLT